jgi:hypothetical protein
MKKIKLLIIVLSVVFIFNSCDDSVNPKADFEEEYILSCIIRADTTYQMATISHTYNVEGFDPGTNTSDPFIKGARIKIYYNDAVYDFRDTSIARSGDARYNTPLNFYYTNKLQPIYSLPIKIEALLPNGKLLKAESEVISLSTVFLHATSNTLPPQAGASKISFNWGELNVPVISKGIYYSPELVILYSYNNKGIKEKRQKKVPVYLLNTINGKEPVYPRIVTGIFDTSFEMEAVNRAMEEISEGDPDKSNYIIENAIFRLLMMDAALANYYSLQKTFLDEFSVRINQPDVTNIQGGLGIFGSYSIKQISLEIAGNYISSFGYSTK